MATKQWIGIEEAATKYQVSTRRIITWCKRQEIIYSEVGDYLMLDENSLTDCLERNIRFSLSEEEHKRRMDDLVATHTSKNKTRYDNKTMDWY